MCCNHNQQDPDSVTMSVVLNVALAERPIQMRFVGDSIHRSSKSSLHCLLLYDIGQFLPLGV
jgi:hypothetical protein